MGETVAMGGPAAAMMSASGDSVRLLGLDADPAALSQARERLVPFGDRVALAHSSFDRLEGAAAAHGISRARANLLELGVSSWQLEQSGRGYPVLVDEPPHI